MTTAKKPKGRRGNKGQSPPIKQVQIEVPVESSQSQSKSQDSFTNFSEEELMQWNPPVCLQLWIYKGNQGAVKLNEKCILLTDREKALANEENAKLFDLEGITFRNNDFLSDVQPKINACIQDNINQELHDYDNGCCIYHTNYPPKGEYYFSYSQDLHCKNPTPLTCSEDWKNAKYACCKFIINEENFVESVILHLICHTRIKKDPPKRMTQQSQELSQGDGIMSQQPNEDEDRYAGMDWGFDKSLKICVQPPTVTTTKNHEDRFVLRSQKTQFSPQETIFYGPPFTIEYLDSLEEPESLQDHRYRLAHYNDLVKTKALKLQSYRDRDNECVVGNESILFGQYSHSSTTMTPLHSTEEFWRFVKKRFGAQSSEERKNHDPIEIRVSIGWKTVGDVVYSSPLGFIESPDNTDDETQYNMGAVDDPHIFSQDSAIRKRHKPARQEAKRSQSERREEQTISVQQMEKYLWKVFTSEESPLQYAVTLEHYKDLLDYFMKKRTDGQLINQIYACMAGQKDTWPTMADIPQHLHRNKKRYFGKSIKKGKFPVTNPEVMGSYLSFEITAEERDEHLRKQRQESFSALVKALAGNKAASTKYVIRLQLGQDCGNSASTRFIDFTVDMDAQYKEESDKRAEKKTDDSVDSGSGTDDAEDSTSAWKGTLKTFYEDDAVQKRVRSGFSDSVADLVRNGEEELVINYRNNQNMQLYQQMPVKHLHTFKVSDLLASIPRDNNGPIAGAAFPVLLLVETREIVRERSGRFI